MVSLEQKRRRIKREIEVDVNSTVGFEVCVICNLVMVQGRIGGAKVSEKDEEPAKEVSLSRSNLLHASNATLPAAFDGFLVRQTRQRARCCSLDCLLKNLGGLDVGSDEFFPHQVDPIRSDGANGNILRVAAERAAESCAVEVDISPDDEADGGSDSVDSSAADPWALTELKDDSPKWNGR